MEYPVLSPQVAHSLTTIVASGVTGRGPSALCVDGVWQTALTLIARSQRIAVVSGFYVPVASAPETDGPTGSAVLARALSALGKDVAIWTDSLCLGTLRACANVLAFPDLCVHDAGSAKTPQPAPDADLLIYIERLGRARDDNYYNMRGENITQWTAPLDEWALSGAFSVIAIGDGGNEVGMGAYSDALTLLMPDFSRCLCRVEADVCIPVDVSNWGAYALTTALSAISGRALLQTEQEEMLMLQALCREGAVDGITKRCDLSVDGLELSVQLKIRAALEALLPANDQAER